MNRLSRLSIGGIEVLSLFFALTVFSEAVAIDDTQGPNAHVRTQVKRSVVARSCYCCLATYDISCCHACTSYWDAPIPFYAPEKKRDGSGSSASSGGGSELAPLLGDSQHSSRASVTDLSLVSCTCCQATQSKSCCEMCKITTGLGVETAGFKKTLPVETVVRKRGLNLGSAYSTCMCCSLTRWKGCCYRCPYGY